MLFIVYHKIRGCTTHNSPIIMHQIFSPSTNHIFVVTYLKLTSDIPLLVCCSGKSAPLSDIITSMLLVSSLGVQQHVLGHDGTVLRIHVTMVKIKQRLVSFPLQNNRVIREDEQRRLLPLACICTLRMLQPRQKQVRIK